MDGLATALKSGSRNENLWRLPHAWDHSRQNDMNDGRTSQIKLVCDAVLSLNGNSNQQPAATLPNPA